MIANLTWVPAAGGGTQTVQFQIEGTSTWITYSTVGPTVGTLGITGLNYNTVYNFQVINNCPTGSTAIVSGQSYDIQCPILTITPSASSAQVQFFHLGGTIDTYTVNLLNAASTTILATNVLVAPFQASITTSFLGLIALTSYSVQVIPSSFGLRNNGCVTTSFTTSNTPVCPPPAGLAVTFS